MNEAEQKIAESLNRYVDARVGSRRPAPARQPAAPTVPVRHGVLRDWRLPLLAAAAVTGLVAGTVGLVTVHGGGSDSHRPVPVGTQPGPTLQSSPTATTRSSATAEKSAAPGSPPWTVVALGGARIAIPRGWAARDYAQVTGAASFTTEAWCLTPNDAPATGENACPVVLNAIPAHWTGTPVEADAYSGFADTRDYCLRATEPNSLTGYGDRAFGGRMADYRSFSFRCQGRSYDIEQYVVDSGPGYVLAALHADAAIRDAIGTIVAHSDLPAQTSALRYSDYGIVTSVSHQADGYHVRLDRVVQNPGGQPINNNPATYDYVIPDALAAGAKPVVGRTLLILTDGSTVTGGG